MIPQISTRYNFLFREGANPVFFTDLLLKNYGILDLVFICDDSILEGYASDLEMERAARAGLSLFSDSRRIEELKNSFDKNYLYHIKLLNKIDKLDKLGNDQLTEILENFCTSARNNIKIYFSTEPHFLATVEEKLREFISQKCQDKTKANQYLINLTTPFRADNFPNKEKIAWNDLVKNLRMSKFNTRKGIANHFKKFRFLFYHKKTDYLQKRFEEMSSWSNDKLDQFKKEIVAADKIIEQNRKNTIQILNPPSEILILCRSIRDTAALRLNLRLFMSNGTAGDNVLCQIAKRKYLGLNQIENCTVAEVRNLMKNNKIDLSKINERNNGYVAVRKKGKWNFYIGKEANEIAKRTKPTIDRNVTHIKGNTASMGNVRGPVRIIKNISENLDKRLQEMKAGEILVTEMTRPRLMDVCKKAAAIITDEGGINCHAAIISRELNIPCIIGTKVATQLLNNGDIVEINGDNGSVEIIERYLP